MVRKEALVYGYRFHRSNSYAQSLQCLRASCTGTQGRVVWSIADSLFDDCVRGIENNHVRPREARLVRGMYPETTLLCIQVSSVDTHAPALRQSFTDRSLALLARFQQILVDHDTVRKRLHQVTGKCAFPRSRQSDQHYHCLEAQKTE